MSAWFVAVLGLVTAAVAGSVEVAVGDHVTSSGWPGAGVSVVLLALLGAALRGPRPARPGPPVRVRRPGPGPRRLAGRRRRAARTRRARRPRGVAHLVVLSATEQDGAVGDLTVTTEPVVPRVGQQMQDSEREVRVLSISWGQAGARVRAAPW